MVGMTVCASGYCDEPAVAAIHTLRPGASLIRTDHLDPPEWAADARCMDCLLDEVRKTLDPAR